ncbi:MAG TPA: glycosyltransferase family 2 protein [Acidobacteriaceae bacterium]|nr:glycosyltransferase family 2 protein [Acidobacteriaceae bacterium]
MEPKIEGFESAGGAAFEAVPLVSVAVTAFNLEQWIGRAMDSALAQQVSFPFEIVVADDCSRDGTTEILRSYQQRYPDVVRLIERPANVGMQRNYYDLFQRCRGKYIAWLDADDYWTDPLKLERQIAAMEADPSISVCCHFVRWTNVDGSLRRERFPPMAPGRYGVEDVLRSCFVPTASAVFRRGVEKKLPEWYLNMPPVSDWPVWVLSALEGDIFLMDGVMADYFMTPGSACNSKGPMFLTKIEAGFYEKVESILPRRLHRMVRAEKGTRYERIAYWTRKEEGDFVASRRAAVKAFCSPFPADNLGSKSKSLLAAMVREAEWRLKGGR